MAKIIIHSPNLIKKSMAGAAIRSWEFAKALADNHQVVLLSPGPVEDIDSDSFTIVSIKDPASKRHFLDADVLITQRLTAELAFMTIKNKVKVIIDAYDPSPLELHEQFKMRSLRERRSIIATEVSRILFGFQMANGILCASEKQRELWLGFFLAQNVITPSLYDQDSSLREFLTVVPFGLSTTIPQKNGEGFREKYGFSEDDKILLWGGGIWDWFDPLSLIKAVHGISQTRNDVKLVFMGIKPPDPMLPITSMSSAAMQLSEDLEVMNKSVFFNTEWVPYEQRHNFLLDADIGVSTHFDHLETRFSFRTRMLDYLWSGLPILATQGDSFADIIEQRELGAVVPYQDVPEIVKAILRLIDHPEQLQKIKKNIHTVREEYYWPSVVEPLQKMIERILISPPRSIWQDRKTLMQFFLKRVREEGIIRYGLKKCYAQYKKIVKQWNVRT